MADQETQDRAIQTRIIKHMNADHHDSIALFLLHHHAPSPLPATLALTSLDLHSMTITANNRPYSIPFTPPLDTYRSARPRLIEMDLAARVALDRSDVTVGRYIPPSARDALCVLLPAVGVLLLAAYLLPGDGRPGGRFVGGGWRLWGGVGGAVVVGRAVEVGLFAAKKVRRYNVDLGGRRVWWLWMGSVCVEGWVAWRRFDGLVRRLGEEKARKKH